MSLTYTLKKLLSYIYPVILEKHASSISGDLEVSLQYGKLVLDSTSANYSYGSLHQVFQEVIKEFTFDHSKKNALILGFGGGSIASILNQEKKLALDIDGVELDPVVIDIFEKHFTIHAEGNIRIHQSDAIRYLKNQSKLYDYIFIDVFENLKVPRVLLNPEFISLLKKHSLPHTQIAMNTMLKEDHPFVQSWNTHFKDQAFIRYYDISNLVLFTRPAKSQRLGRAQTYQVSKT